MNQTTEQNLGQETPAPERRQAPPPQVGSEAAYQEVSLRAVELLARAQRAADEAVAEAQAYARDLETTAREQYQHILQRAQEAARTMAGVTPEDGVQRALAAGENVDPAVDAQQLEYVRTYARVAYTQLKAVLGALNEELDRLSDLAEAPGPARRDEATNESTGEARGEGSAPQ